MPVCERLTVYYADRGAKGGSGPVNEMDAGLNFVSRLRASSLMFSEHTGPLSIKCAYQGREFYLSLVRVQKGQRGFYRDVERMGAVRPSTRAELSGCLHRARDFVDANFPEQVSLPEVATVACLSPHHFLRSYKQLFRETPRQY